MFEAEQSSSLRCRAVDLGFGPLCYPPFSTIVHTYISNYLSIYIYIYIHTYLSLLQGIFGIARGYDRRRRDAQEWGGGGCGFLGL